MIMQGIQAQFELKTVLIFNPTLKPDTRKPTQEQIQQAKILFYYPPGSPVEQKRNHVGLAEGLYSFIDAMSSNPAQQPKQQVTYTNTDIFIIKQVEPDIWIFLGLTKLLSCTYCKHSVEYVTKQIHTYSHEPIDEGICFNFMDHFYTSFVTFQGTIGLQVALKERMPDFQKVMTEFIGRYVLLNENQNTKKMDLNFYLFGGVRLTPLDPNYLLKFNYYQSILTTLDTCSKDLIIFYGGYLVFNTMAADIALFFFNYYYSLGQPFKFDDSKIKKKFTNQEHHKQLGKMKYGYFINSLSYGGVEAKKDQKKDTKISNILQSRETFTTIKHSDLLGLENNTEINLIQVHLKVDGKLVPMGMNTYQSGKLLMISFSNTAVRDLQRIQVQNRFFQDNVDRFNEKLNSVITPLTNQQQFHRFIYINRINMGGKMTIPLNQSQEVNVTLRNIFSKLNDSVEDCVLTTTSSYWVYGLRRLNRVLVVIMSNEIAIHKIEDYMERLSKDYFPAIYI